MLRLEVSQAMVRSIYFPLSSLFSLHILSSNNNGKFDSSDGDSHSWRYPVPSNLGYFPHLDQCAALPALPRATRNMALLSAAWGAKKRDTSSSKNVRPLAPKRWA